METEALPLLVRASIAAQVGWFVWALFRFARRNDELPIVISGFLFYCGSYRFLSRHLGFREWGALDYGLTFSVDYASACSALTLMTFGESVLLAVYWYWQNKVLLLQEEEMPAIVLSRLRLLLLVLTIVGLPLVLWSQISASILIAKGFSMAFQISSYVQLFPMMIVALAVFVFLSWRFGALRNGREKFAAIILLLVIAYLTFSPSNRFRFLGWVLGGTYIVSTRWFGLKRIPVLCVGVLAALVSFGIAGAMRNYAETDKFQAGLKRTTSAEDANMLDGLVYLMRVYPQMLPYRYGGEHFEILLRPIPRSMWAGKPVGGYMNKLGLFNAQSAGTTGISPTLFGSFYTEGGWIGVFILSVIYGWGLAWIVRWSSELRPLFGVLVRAGLLAGLIPLLRGGDLPGIYSWLGMAYWPLLVFLWWNRAHLRLTTGKSLLGAHGQQSRRYRHLESQDRRHMSRVPRFLLNRKGSRLGRRCNNKDRATMPASL